jgi:hypothetical protein
MIGKLRLHTDTDLCLSETLKAIFWLYPSLSSSDEQSRGLGVGDGPGSSINIDQL